MPVNYNYTENGYVYSFDEIFVPVDLFREGSLWVWGAATDGRLGNGATTGNISTPVTTFAGGTNWKQVSSMPLDSTVAIKTDGTLWTWGRNDRGQLGNASIVNASTPVTTFAGGTNWKQIDVGGTHIAAIKTDGTLWIWGRNSSGQLGDNTSGSNILTPITTFVGGTTWKQVSAGYSHTAAIKTDGTLWIWGSGANGRLGNAVTTNVSTPVTTFTGGNNWKQISAGRDHIAAIKTDGTLWNWGLGTSGQLGNAVITNVSTPVTTFAGGNNWKQISAGNAYTAAIKTDGTLWTWGGTNNKAGNSGVLGNNSTDGSSTPITTFAGGNNWKQVACGDTYTAAIKTDGTLWNWGSGANGRLGNAVTTNVSTPVTTFAGGTNWRQISAGSGQPVALTYIDPVL